MKQMTSQLVATAAKFASFGAAAAAAMKVVKDAFFSNEQQLDEWGRVVESSKSLYNGFLNALNNGDISGYLNNISNITKAAREAYDALDALATYNAFNQINVEKTRTSMTESIADYRSGTGTKDAVRAAGDAYKKELEERKKLEKDAYLAKVKEVAAQRGVNANDLITALSGTYGSYQMLKNVQPTGTKTVNYGGGMFGGGGSYTVDVAVGRQEKLGAALRALNDTELQSLQALGAQAERTGNEIAQVDKQLARVLNGRGGASASGGKGGGKSTPVPLEGSIDAQVALVDKLTKKWKAATDQVGRDGYLKQLEEAQRVLEKMMEKPLNAPGISYGAGDLAGKGGSGLFQDALFKEDTTLQTQQNLADMLGVAISKTPFKLDEKSIREVGEAAEKASQKEEFIIGQELGKLSSGMGSIVGGIETLGVELPQGLKDVVNGISGIVSVVQGIVTILEVIKALETAQSFKLWSTGGVVHAASGYTVPGNYGYDAVPSLLTSGEVVLNRAQVGNLASQLQEQGTGGGQHLARVSGEQIYIAMNNYLRRSGKGELITWR